MDVKDGAGKRRPHHAGLEVSWREADEDADAEQDRHAAVEDAFDSSIDSSVRGLLAGRRRKDGLCCHVLLRLQGLVPRGRRRWIYRNAWKISRNGRFTKVFRREVSQAALFAPLSSNLSTVRGFAGAVAPGQDG